MADAKESSTPFEREIAKEENDNAYGEVIRLAPPSIRMMAILMSFVAFFTTIFIWQVSYTKKSPVAGSILIVEKPVTVVVPSRGTFQSILVKNGQKVRSGEVVAIIKRDLTLEGGVEVAKTQSGELAGDKERQRRALDRLEGKAKLVEERYQEGVRVIDQEVAAAERILVQYEKRDAFLSKKMGKMQKMREQKILASFEMESTNNELTSNRERMLQEKQNIEGIKSRIDLLKIEREQSLQRLREARTAIESQISGIDRQIVYKKAEQGIEMRVTAAGRVSGLLAKEGDSANLGTPLFTLLPDSSELEAELYIPAATLPFVKNDQPIYLAIDAFPPQKYGLFAATIKSTDAIPMTDMERNIKGVGVPSYVVKVALSQQSVTGLREKFALASGMTVTTKVTMTTRTLWDWLTEPVQRSLKMSKEAKDKD